MASKPDDDSPYAAQVEVRTAAGVSHAIDDAWITRNLRLVVDHLSQSGDMRVHRLNGLIVDDARMTHLHERHSGLATTTDVLTFDLRDDASQPIEVDIVACADEAARRAADFGHSLERELLLYFVHGLLHCAGYDDHAEEDWRRMHKREDAVLRAIGIGATFHRGTSEEAEGAR